MDLKLSDSMNGTKGKREESVKQVEVKDWPESGVQFLDAPIRFHKKCKS